MSNFSEADETDELESLDMYEPEPDDADGLRSRGPDPRLGLTVKILKQVHDSIAQVIKLLESGDTREAASQLAGLVTTKKDFERKLEDISGSRVIEGVFNGEAMIGSDGRVYSVPPNYSSKSRLVEGDMMKLTIKADGGFIFKQIGPIERRRAVGCLAFNASNSEYIVICGEISYRVLTASVTYFKGQPGDEVILLVPKSTPSIWAAVENIVKS